MKLFFRNLPFAISTILFGLISILIYFQMIELKKINLVSFVLILFGLYLVYKELNFNRVGLIAFGIFSFFFGLTLFVINQINLIFYYKTVFSILIFIAGMIFLFLFINNLKNKKFLHISLFLILLSICSIYFRNFVPFINKIELINKFIIQNWYLVFITIGLILISGSLKK